MSENSTDLPDDLSISATENLIEIIFMAIFGVSGTYVGFWAMRVIRRNSNLNGIIEVYLQLDILSLFLVNFGHLCWGVPCAIWTLNEYLPLLDNIISCLVFVTPTFEFLAKLLLGVNRFFALAFNGFYYFHFEKTFFLQYFIMFTYPMATAVFYLIPGCRTIFVPYGANWFYVENGECGPLVVWYTQILSKYISIPTNTFFDVAVFYMMRKRIKSFQAAASNLQSQQKAAQLKREFRLAAQMICNLLTGLALNISQTLANIYLEELPYFAQFFIFTGLWQFCGLVTCFSFVVLLAEKTSKQKSIVVSVSG